MTNFTVIKGNVLENNPIPLPKGNEVIRLKGRYHEKKAEIVLDEETLNKHTLLIGSTGCGKTTLMNHIIGQVKSKMTNNDVMIIFDTKGDFYKKFYQQGDLVIGNSSMYSKKSEIWNIYKEIVADGWDDESITLNAQEICRCLFAEREKNSNNVFFPNAAKDLLAAILIIFIREGRRDPSERNNLLFNDLLKDFLNMKSPKEIIDAITYHPDLVSIASYIKDKTAQSQGVLSEMYSVVRELLIGVFAREGMFSIREFVRKKEGKTLFIEYDLSIGNTLTPMYRLLFDLALKEALGRKKGIGNVYLICDEFKLLPNLKHIEDGVNFGRSLGIKVFAAIQSMEQLYEIYGKSRGGNIASGFSSIYTFKTNDVTTRNYIKDLFGKNMILEQYQSLDHRLIEEKRIANVVEDWDLAGLKIGEAIVGLPFSKPFKFYFDK